METRTRTKPVVVGLVVLAFLVVGYLSYLRALDVANIPGLDLMVYREGGSELMHNPGGLYAPIHGEPFNPGLPFTYPPFAAALFTALAVLPFWVSFGVVAAVSAVLGFFMCQDLSQRLMRRFPAAGQWLGVWPLFGLLVISGPFRDSIMLGQVNIILTGVIYLALAKSRTMIPFAIVLGLTGSIKLTPLALFLVPLALGKIKPILVGGLTFVAAQAITLLIWKDQTIEFWTEAVVDPSRVGGVGYIENLSLQGLVERLGLPKGVWIVGALAVIALTLFIMVAARKRIDVVAQLGLAAACSLLISPVTWSHHWVWWPVVAYAWVSLAFLVSGWLRTVILAGVAYLVVFLMLTPKLVVALFGFDPDGELPAWAYGFDGAFVLIACALLVIGVALVRSKAFAKAPELQPAP